jgi:hypothetical protein
VQERSHEAGLQRHAGLALQRCALCFATELCVVLNVRLPSDCEWLPPAAPTKPWMRCAPLVRCAPLAWKRALYWLASDDWWMAALRALYWRRCDDWWMAASRALYWRASDDWWVTALPALCRLRSAD